jgi:hypothetical protein
MGGREGGRGESGRKREIVPLCKTQAHARTRIHTQTHIYQGESKREMERKGKGDRQCVQETDRGCVQECVQE